MKNRYRARLRAPFLIPSVFLLASCGGGSSGDSADESMADSNDSNPPVEVSEEPSPSVTPEDTVLDTDTDEPTETGDPPIEEPSTPETTESPTVPDNDSNGTSTTVSGDVSQFGVVDVGFSGLVNEVSLSAGFFEANLPISADQLASQFSQSGDVCTVSDIGGDGDMGDFDLPDIVDQIDTISAGEVIPFTSPSGSFAELQRTEAFGFTFYQTADEVDSLPGPIPEGLEFSIPGDQFPAFDRVPVPVSASLEVTSPSFGERTTVDTVFIWNSNDSANSRVTIDMISGGLTSGITVNCEVVDDGRFEFPSGIRAQLGDDFSSLFTTIRRESRSVLQSGRAVLFVTSSSGS